jgi:hypothetical protein
MSGTRAKGKGKGRVKRQEVQSEDGWTVITHGLANVHLDNKNQKKKFSGKKVSGEVPTQTVVGLTAPKLVGEFKNLQERWKSTSVAQQIDALKTKWEVKQAVCIGIGSFSRDWEHRHRSMWQLVLFLSIASSSSMPKFAQDPAFTPIDTEFLSLLNITTTETGIEEHINETTFVYSPFVDWFVLLPVFLKGKDPAVYVGNEVLGEYDAYATDGEKAGKLGECNALGKSFLASRECVKLKDFEQHAHALNGMVVYTKTKSPPTSPTELPET